MTRSHLVLLNTFPKDRLLAESPAWFELVLWVCDWGVSLLDTFDIMVDVVAGGGSVRVEKESVWEIIERILIVRELYTLGTSDAAW